MKSSCMSRYLVNLILFKQTGRPTEKENWSTETLSMFQADWFVPLELSPLNVYNSVTRPTLSNTFKNCSRLLINREQALF